MSPTLAESRRRYRRRQSDLRPAIGMASAVRGEHVTILFDGVAYGMLLSVPGARAVRHARLMNLINLAHGAFAMAGGYITRFVRQPDGRPVSRRAAARVPYDRRARRAAARAHALCPFMPRAISIRCCSRSASFSCPWPPSTTSWASRSSGKIPQMLQGQPICSGSGVGYRLLIIVICGLLTIALQLR